MSHFNVYFLSILICLTACKEPEPFEYPEDPGQVEPAWITETERVIDKEEGWIGTQRAEKCDPNLSLSNIGFFELNYTRGFASIQLLPTDSACEVEVALKTEFSNSEIADEEWDELHFEYTYSEYSGEPGTEYWIELNYKGLELELNLAPVISSLIPFDTTDGLFELYFENDEPVFELNGKPFDPDFGEGSLNRFDAHGNPDANSFEVRMVSVGTDRQSYTIFQYLRVPRFGIEPD